MALADRIEMDEDTMNDSREPSELDRLVDNIIVAIDADESAIYSKDVIAEFRNPSNIGPIDDADGNGIADGLCMDTMEIWIKVEEDRITRCTFYTDGCGATIACGSRLTKMVIGKTTDEAEKLRAEELELSLGGLPEDHKHCTNLAIIAFRNAIRDRRGKMARNEEGGD